MQYLAPAGRQPEKEGLLNEFRLLKGTNDVPEIDSREVAAAFGRNHFDILRSIKNITDPRSGYSREFIKQNFKKNTYKDRTNRTLPCYLMTRDGLKVLALGFTGSKANGYKELLESLLNGVS